MCWAPALTGLTTDSSSRLAPGAKTECAYVGFVYGDDEQQKEEERASDYLHRFTADALHQFMDILDLPRGADKKVRRHRRAVANRHAQTGV